MSGLDWTLVPALFGLSVISGMLGIGVALVALPALSLVYADLFNQVQPLALLLNGVTALFSAAAFQRAGLVDWRRARWLAFAASIAAPLGAWGARSAPVMLVWMCYFAAVLFVLHRMMFVAPPRSVATENTTAILGFAVPASALSGFLGVGPGFLLVPLMAHFGIDLRKAAAINSVAVVPASFLAALPHVSHQSVRTTDVLALSAASAAGAVAGAWLTSHRVAASALKVVFVITLVLTAAARVARNFI